MFDLQARRHSLLRHQNEVHFLRQKAESLLAERLLDVKRNFSDILFHCHPEIAALPEWECHHLHRYHLLLDSKIEDILVDSYDLVYSLLEFHWDNHLSDSLLRFYFSLREEGLLQACFIGGGSLQHLRECLLRAETEICGGASPRVIPFIDMGGFVGELQKIGFRLPVVDREILDVRYRDIYALMRDLRLMSEVNFLTDRRRNFSRRDVFAKANEIYQNEFSDDKGLIVKFELIFVHAWR